MAWRHWQVAWSHSGLWALRNIPWLDAGRVDAAVQRFAETGEGSLERLKNDPVGAVLQAPPYLVRLTLDFTEHVCTVWWIYLR
jgi:hypothetical protein